MNVKSALLNGDLENEIFMKTPPGVEAKEGQVVTTQGTLWFEARKRNNKCLGKLRNAV